MSNPAIAVSNPAIAVPTATYNAAALAWNNHAQGGVDWKAGTALLSGALAAWALIYLAHPLWRACCTFFGRRAVQLQCCIIIHTAPENLPVVRTANRPGQRKSFQRLQQHRATAAQWNRMRMALGPLVPDQSVAELVSNYGDDAKEAARAYYGPGYCG